MPLYPTDQSTPAMNGENRLAEDHRGDRVVVSASHEAIQDYGWSEIWDVASGKYDAGDIASLGPPPLVRVTTADF